MTPRSLLRKYKCEKYNILQDKTVIFAVYVKAIINTFTLSLIWYQLKVT